MKIIAKSSNDDMVKNSDKQLAVADPLASLQPFMVFAVFEVHTVNKINTFHAENVRINHAVIWLVMSTFQTSGQRGYRDVTRPFLSLAKGLVPQTLIHSAIFSQNLTW